MPGQENGGGLFDQGPDDKTRYIVAGVLGAIIAVAVGVVAWQFVGDGTADAIGKGDAEIPFECMECGREFKKTFQIHDELLGQMPIDCELCRKKQCAVAMQKCPGCGKFCASEAMKVQARHAVAIMNSDKELDWPEMPANICPKCGLDITAYRKKRAVDLPGRRR